MKLLVMFGSKSDANIYEPLKAKLLQDGHEIDFRMISVHRSPELLDKELEAIQVDAVIAGAGLAAHLPGVLASKLLVPVFGIPCSAALGGVDALLAILQMPFGIPVMATAPDKFTSPVEFLRRWSNLEVDPTVDGVNLVVDRHKRNAPHMAALLQKAEKITSKNKVELEILDRPKENAVNVCLVDISAADPEAPLPYPEMDPASDEVRVYVPVLGEQAYRDPVSAIHLARRIQTVPHGLWVGLNNVGNGVLVALQLANKKGKYSAFLTNAKKGYVHA